MLTNEVMLLGGGAESIDGQSQLSAPSSQRVDRFLSYYEANKSAFTSKEAFVLCSGGYALLASGVDAPAYENREGVLMADELVRSGVPSAIIEVEAESYSTVTNFTHSIEQGVLVPERYQEGVSLGIITHPDHMLRVVNIARQLGILNIEQLATEHDLGGQEKILRFLYKAALLGAHDPKTLENREWLLYQPLKAIRRAMKR